MEGGKGNAESPIGDDGAGNAGVVLGIRARENARAFFHQSLEFGLKKHSQQPFNIRLKASREKRR